jgi:hypothetical protein
VAWESGALVYSIQYTLSEKLEYLFIVIEASRHSVRSVDTANRHYARSVCRHLDISLVLQTL